MIEFNNAEDYLNLPHLIKHFGLLWRFKWRPNSLGESPEDFIDLDSVVINEGNGDVFAYDRGGRD
jgi:hypothetical protein